MSNHHQFPSGIILLLLAAWHLQCRVAALEDTQDVQLCPSNCACILSNKDLIVNCTARSLDRIPDQLPMDITNLLLSNNEIHEIPRNIFQKYSKLSSLDLSYNGGININNDSLLGLTNLEKLVLRQENHSIGISCYKKNDNPFHDLIKLKVLDMRGTNLFIQPCINSTIRTMNFSDQEFTTGNMKSADPNIPCYKQIMQDLKNLEYLAIRCDGLTLDEGFAYLRKLKILDLSQSSINITRSTFTVLKNLPLERLSLRSMQVGKQPGIYFEPQALSELRHLKVVDISCHDTIFTQQNVSFKWTDILQSFENSSSLHTLIMDGVLGSTVPPFADHMFFEDYTERLTPTTLSENLFSPLAKVKLKQLSIQWNSISVVKPFLTYLKHLEYLNLDYNFVNFFANTTILVMQLMRGKIKEIHMSHQYRHFYNCVKENPLFLTTDISFTTRIRRSTFPLHDISIAIPSSLEQVYINNFPDLGNQFSNKPHYTLHVINHFGGISGYPENNLTMLDFSSSGLRRINFAFIGLNHLKELKLDNNMLEFVHPKHFKYLPSLEKLWLSKNRFGLLTNKENLTEIFSDLATLKVLDLADNFLQVLPKEIFKNCSNLEILNLAGNAMIRLDYDFSRLPNMKELDLSRNQLSGINDTEIRFLEKIASKHNLTVELGQNDRLRCTCDYIHFVKWIQDNSTKKTHIPNTSNLTCMLSDGTHLVLSKVDINGLHLECIKNQIILITLTCALVIVVLCITIWYHRWTLKYWYYKHKLARKSENKNTEGRRVQASYDAYISLPETDSQWGKTIRQKLEDEMKLHVFFPERDFNLGGNIGEETVRGIEVSKKMLLFINENYDYEYQNFALHMSYFRGKGFIIPIIKGEVAVNKFPRVLRHLLRDDIYLDWPTDSTEQEKFWRILKKAIKTRKGVYIEKNDCPIYYS